ncbi:hypothetical protein acsn021_24700 [Anaerocolumna cellulosilytica]|uniref:Uncharacterized protein n=1 Tax=Anaerocolumna cellulosilytica TaxID=433286 RepID=A0A6S6R7B0_9FIRM|nr:DUF5688 family protein [Anaerocolumna cellulosilytica]MBB5193883.1 hypothetical protein [Anaerocolumna cellulosilytica]BCJ94901.1 hypothetical protein acsn021_24700 [Anaerocolumna cellulosilytica]
MTRKYALKPYSYSEFLKKIKLSVKRVMGEGYTVEINHILKNNSIELDCLIIRKDRDKVSPNIYLNTYYEIYMEGQSLDDIVDEIIQVYEDTKGEGEGEALALRYNLEEMKPYIIYRLVNYKKNKKLLEGVPYISFLDLAITFHCLVKNTEEGIGTIRVTNEHLNEWGIDIEELKEYAVLNTPKLFPPMIKTMQDIMEDMFQQESHMNEMERPINDLEQDNTAQEHLEDLCIDETMYVISNAKSINGASCLIYPNVIKNLSELLDTDLYILPSSIHEIIALKADNRASKEYLLSMVADVNGSQVPEEDILSYNIYFYSKKRAALTVL